MVVRVHPTAEIEEGVDIGEGTSVWAHVHMRGPTRVGRDCIVGEKTYLGPGVTVGDRVKLNAMVYIPLGVTLESGVMVGAGTVFTNDRYPRATDPDYMVLADSGPGEHIHTTVVREGASVGAGCTIGSDLEIGRFAMVGMGAVVTRDVAAFHLVVGNPARPIAVVCRCGPSISRFVGDDLPDGEVTCSECGRVYRVHSGRVDEIES